MILFSHQGTFDGEADVLNTLFSQGLELFHLRKKDFSEEKVIELLRHISPQYYNRIIIHEHFNLVDQFGLKGVHYTQSLWFLWDQLANKSIDISIAVIRPEDIENVNPRVNLVIYNSLFPINRGNAYQRFLFQRKTKNAIKNKPKNTKVCASGGVTIENLKAVRALGFDCVGVMSPIWDTWLNSKNMDLVVEKFHRLRTL